MNTQELLILSFFDSTNPKELNSRNLTTEMIEAGIGWNVGSSFQYQSLIHQLINKGLLESYKNPSSITKGTSEAFGKELLVLSDKAVQILQREESKRNHEAFITELQFNKLKTEHDLLSNQLADYNKTKRLAMWAIIISVVSVLVAILSLLNKK